MSDFDTASLGDALRAERQRQGKDLATMAVETKICSAVLQALERNQFDGIPGGSYRQHFLRQYAHALGLDEGEAIGGFPPAVRRTGTTPTDASQENADPGASWNWDGYLQPLPRYWVSTGLRRACIPLRPGRRRG